MDSPLAPPNTPTDGSTPGQGLRADTRTPSSEIRATPQATPVSDELRRHELAQMVTTLFQRAREARRPLIQQWTKNYRTLNNRTWSTRAEPWMPAPEVAEIWPIVASLVAWITDQRPGFETTPCPPPFSQFSDHYDVIAEQLNAILDAGFAEYQEDAEIEKLLWDVATYGIGYLETVWQPWLADGLGDCTTRRRDPFSVYPDPLAHNDKDANYFCTADIMSMDDLDRAFPGARKFIDRDLGNIGDVDEAPNKLDNSFNSRAPRVNLAPIAPNTSSNYGESPRGRQGMVRETPTVVVITAWIRHHQVLTPKDDETLQPGTARVVDRWKCIVVCGNTVLLEKWADEIYGHQYHPFSRMVLFDTGEFYGPALVEFLSSPQESINRMLASIETNLMLLGNPIYMSRAQTNRGGRPNITNRPGQRIEGDKNTDGWMDPPQIHPDFLNMISYYEGRIETISGLSAIMRGFAPTGRNGEDVISSVQDSAFVRIRATIRNLERCMRDAASKKVANITEFYTEPRLIAITGPDGGKVRLATRARHFYTLPNDKGEQAIPLRFTLRVDAGSDHPTSRQSRSSEADFLYSVGAIDDIEMLKAKRWPNWPIVAKRVMEMKAQAGTLGAAPGGRKRRS